MFVGQVRSRQLEQVYYIEQGNARRKCMVVGERKTRS